MFKHEQSMKPPIKIPIQVVFKAPCHSGMLDSLPTMDHDNPQF